MYADDCCLMKEPAVNIGPTSYSTNTVNVGSTIAAPASGYYNCIEWAVFYSTNAHNIYILDGNTTAYSLLTYTASSPHQVQFQRGLCGTAATAMTVKDVSTLGTTVTVNYKGFVGR